MRTEHQEAGVEEEAKKKNTNQQTKKALLHSLLTPRQS